MLKILRRVDFGTGSTFGTDVANRYGEGSEVLVSLGKRGRENGTDTEKLRRWQNSTASSAVLVLVRKGPLCGSCFTWKRGSKMRQKCVKIASKMRQRCAEHLLGGNTFLDDTEF